jgi:hypothetical protein
MAAGVGTGVWGEAECVEDGAEREDGRSGSSLVVRSGRVPTSYL